MLFAEEEGARRSSLHAMQLLEAEYTVRMLIENEEDLGTQCHCEAYVRTGLEAEEAGARRGLCALDALGAQKVELIVAEQRQRLRLEDEDARQRQSISVDIDTLHLTVQEVLLRPPNAPLPRHLRIVATLGAGLQPGTLFCRCQRGGHMGWGMRQGSTAGPKGRENAGGGPRDGRLGGDGWVPPNCVCGPHHFVGRALLCFPFAPTLSSTWSGQ